MASSLEVRGLREVQKALYAYSQTMGDKITLSSLRQGANLVKKQAMSNAPVLTGRLRKGMRVTRSKRHSREDVIGVYITFRTAKQKDRGRGKPKDAFYGRWVEHGFTSQDGKNIPGQRFLDRAYERQKGNAVRLIIKTAHAGGESVKRRLGLK